MKEDIDRGRTKKGGHFIYSNLECIQHATDRNNNKKPLSSRDWVKVIFDHF